MLTRIMFRGRSDRSRLVRIARWLRAHGRMVGWEIREDKRAGIRYTIPQRYKKGPFDFKHYEPRPTCRAGRDGLD